MYLDPEHCFKLSQSRIRSTIRIKIGIKINNKRLTEGTQFDKKNSQFNRILQQLLFFDKNRVN